MKKMLGDYTINYHTVGNGPPLLLLHGFPQDHKAWDLIIPHVSKHFTIICPDLPGYGDSDGPAPGPLGEGYSKRDMAGVLLELMSELGYERFNVAGHDRGARVAYRMGLDYPDKINKLVVIDIIPTGNVWSGLDADNSLKLFHWTLLAAHPTVSEHVLSNSSSALVGHFLDAWSSERFILPSALRDYYIGLYQNKKNVVGACADYRAGAHIDRLDDLSSEKLGDRLLCPTHLIWSREYVQAMTNNPAEIWKEWCVELSDTPVESGHFILEEAPKLTSDAMMEFLS